MPDKQCLSEDGQLWKDRLLNYKPGKLLWLVHGGIVLAPNVYPVQFIGFLNEAVAGDKVVVNGPCTHGYPRCVQDPVDLRFRRAIRCEVVDFLHLFPTPRLAYLALIRWMRFDYPWSSIPQILRIPGYNSAGDGALDLRDGSDKDFERAARRWAGLASHALVQSQQNIPRYKNQKAGKL